MNLMAWKLEREIVNKGGDRSVVLYRDGRSPKEQLTKWLMQNTAANLYLFTDREVFNLGYDWEHTDRYLNSFDNDKYYRYDIVMYKDENDNVRLKFYENSYEPPNSFVFVMKANVRCIEGLRHADDKLIESVSSEIAKQYVDDFNNISLGRVYVIRFNNRTNVDTLFDSNVIYGNITKEDVDTIVYTTIILKQRILRFIL